MLFSSAGIALHLFEFEFHACKISFVLYVSSLNFFLFFCCHITRYFAHACIFFHARRTEYRTNAFMDHMLACNLRSLCSPRDV